MRISIVLVLALVGGLTVPAPVVWAQSATTGAIAGEARDTTRAVMPGVTVEAASPALIEKIRSAVTDGQGRYKIVDLRPGVYTVTFSLPGFNTVRREGIELTTGFTATVDADLPVGAVEETVTVTGATPLVDTQNVRQQEVVSDKLLATLPTSSRAASTFVSMIPGLAAGADVGGSSGLQSTNAVWRGWYHGRSGINQRYDGTSFESAYNAITFIANPYNTAEVTTETGGGSADSETQGVVINMVPKEGGNSFTGSAYGTFGNDKLQADNLDDKLRARGLSTTNSAIYTYDSALSVGGPISKDRAWFFATGRLGDAKINVPGVYFNATQGTPLYTPDLNRPAYRRDWLRSGAGRVTWQMTPRNKLNAYGELQHAVKYGDGSFTSPEAVLGFTFWPMGMYQVNWNSPVNNRLLLEAVAGYVLTPFTYLSPGPSFQRVGPDDISILEASNGFKYNALDRYSDPWVTYRYVQRASMSYVTGSHAFKTGFQVQEAGENLRRIIHQNRTYTFLRGQPLSITEYATPFLAKSRIKAELGLYAQDQWTLKRLTLNYGLRFDYWNGSIPAQQVDTTEFVAARSYAPVTGVPNFIDINPRVGAAYDLFGNGRTALKVYLGRFVQKAPVQFTARVNPINSSVNQVNRTWNDSNGDFIPNCDLHNPTANGECGTIDNQSFGQPNIVTRFADDTMRGFGNRNASWDLTAEVQQQLGTAVSLKGGYYRNWASNFEAVDNQRVTPADFDPYCITAPRDPRLPGGGGYQVCGLYDITPSKFGQVDNLVTQASHFFSDGAKANCGVSNSFSATAGAVLRGFGQMCGVSDFFALSIDARLGRLVFGGGVDTGRTVLDNCYVVDNPQQLVNCHAVMPFSAQTQVKFHGTYRLPANMTVSAMFQNVAGPEIEANYPVSNAVIAQSLGRNLAACRGAAVCNATATVPLIKPLTLWEDRRTQVDLRLSKRFPLSSRRSITGNLDVYNALNANSILGVNHVYGASWLRPSSVIPLEAILQGRFIQFSGQLDF